MFRILKTPHSNIIQPFSTPPPLAPGLAFFSGEGNPLPCPPPLCLCRPESPRCGPPPAVPRTHPSSYLYIQCAHFRYFTHLAYVSYLIPLNMPLAIARPRGCLSSSVSTVNTELCSQRFSSALTASSSLFSHSHQGSTPLFQLLSWVAHSSQVPQTGTGGQRRGDEVVLPFPGRLHHLPPLRSTRAPFHFHACYPCTDSKIPGLLSMTPTAKSSGHCSVLRFSSWVPRGSTETHGAWGDILNLGGETHLANRTTRSG